MDETTVVCLRFTGHLALGQTWNPLMRVNLLASSSPEGTAAQGGTIPSQLGRWRGPAFSHGLIDAFSYYTPRPTQKATGVDPSEKPQLCVGCLRCRARPNQDNVDLH